MNLFNFFTPDEHSKRSRKTQLVDFFIGVLLCLSTGEVITLVLFYFIERAISRWVSYENSVALLGLQSVLLIISLIYGLWFSSQREHIGTVEEKKKIQHIIKGLSVVGLAGLVVSILSVIPVLIISLFVLDYLTYPVIYKEALQIIFILFIGICLYFFVGSGISYYTVALPYKHKSQYSIRIISIVSIAVLLLCAIHAGFPFLLFFYSIYFWTVDQRTIIFYMCMLDILFFVGFIFLILIKKEVSSLTKVLTITIMSIGGALSVYCIVHFFSLAPSILQGLSVLYSFELFCLLFLTYHRLFSNNATVSSITTTK